jgi:hypothetical protein
MRPRSHDLGITGTRAIVVGLAAILIAGIGLYVVLKPGSPHSPMDRIDAICGGTFSLVNFTYKLDPGGFMTEGYGYSSGACYSATVAAGSTLTLTLVLHSNDSLNSHTVQTASVAGPYSGLVISPALPVIIGAGGNATFTTSILAPPGGGTFAGPTALVTVS